MVQKYFKCQICSKFVPLRKGVRSSKYCGRSCRGKAYYRRKKAGLPHVYNMHGLSGHPLYSVWESMMDRCYSKNRASYPRYGGRGIGVCERWHDAGNYIADVEALGERPSPSHTLDRIDNNGDYEPGNLQWLDQTGQNFNQRRRKDNTSGHRGVRWDKTRRKWSVTLGLHGVTFVGGRFENFDEAVEARHQLQSKHEVKTPCCN